MKTLTYVCAGTLSLLTSCYYGREVQVERITMELVKIDTLYRQSGDLKVFTWRSDDRLMYQSLEPITSPSPNVGSVMAMLIKR